MFIIYEFELTHIPEKICFYNLSGMCELRISKHRICDLSYDDCVDYIRDKLDDLSITNIQNWNTGIPFNGMEYNIIIRNVYREKIWTYATDLGYEEYLDKVACGKCDRNNLDIAHCNWCRPDVDYILHDPENKILLDDKRLMIAMSNCDDMGPDYYEYCSYRLKCDLDICNAVFGNNACMFHNLPDELKNNIDFILSLRDDTIWFIDEYLSSEIKRNPRFISRPKTSYTYVYK